VSTDTPPLSPEKADLVQSIARSTRTRILMFSHAWGGGVERHVRDLLALLKPHVDVLVLRGFLDAGVELQWHTADASTHPVRIGGFGQESIDAWISALRDLRFTRVHIHHLHGWPIEVLRLFDALDLPVDITLHDYFFPCPQYHLVDENNRYCGEPDVEGCRACVAKRPHTWGVQIDEWRAMMSPLLSRATRIFAPTHDVAERTRKYFPTISPIVIAHYEAKIEIPRVVKVAILGGLSAIKGLKIVGDTAREVQTRHLPIAIRVIGHASETLPDGVTASGTYEDADLPRLLAIERPDVVWFPAQVPETFSYTLSVAMASGLPIVATDFPSFRERLQSHSEKVFISVEATSDAWISAFQRFAPMSASDRIELPSVEKPGSSAISYVEHYLSAFDTQTSPVDLSSSACERFLELVYSSPAAPSTPDHALFALFRLGRYAGHRQSLDAIEAQLASIPVHERQIVGRSIYDQVREQADHFTNAYHQAMRGYEHEKAARVATTEYYVGELDHMHSKFSDAEQKIAQLNANIDHILSSRSWRYTQPLRSFVEGIRALRERFRRTQR
jgi:O-antigen biosynthesis protein